MVGSTKLSRLSGSINITPLLVFAVFVIGILVSGFLNYRYHKNKIIEGKKHELATVGHLKADQVKQWKQERTKDANLLLNNRLLADQLEQFFITGSTEENKELMSFLSNFAKDYDLESLSIINSYGTHQIVLPENSKKNRKFAALIPKYQSYTTAEFVDLPDTDGSTELFIWVPICKDPLKRSSVMAYAILQFYPSFALLSSENQETYEEHGLKVFLADYHPSHLSYLNFGAKEQLPSPSVTEPFQSAISRNNASGVFEQILPDGASFLGSYKKIEGQSWYTLVVYPKKDLDIALKKQLTLIVLIISLFILVLGILSATWWWHQRLLFHRRIYATEMEHRALSKKYEFLVKFAYDIIILTDQDLNIIEFNYRALEVFGYTREEMSKMSIFDLHAPETVSKITSKINILNEEQAVFFETQDVRKDGSIFPVEYSARLFEMDGEKYYQFIGRDISDRRNAEEELDRIFNLVPDMICVASTDGYFQRLNPAWEKTLGYSTKTLLETPFSDLIHPDDLNPTISEIQKQIDGKVTKNFTNRYKCSDGTYKWFDWVANPSPDGEMLFAAARDITEKKQSAEERETMINLLRLLNSRTNLPNLVLSVLSFLKEVTNCEAIALRLKEGDDFPYYETLGFLQQFVTEEKSLLPKNQQDIKFDRNGKMMLECNCGDVLSRSYNYADKDTGPYGSFWSNCLYDTISGSADQQFPTVRRNMCAKFGYQSIVLIPLHMGGEIFGLIQINDRQKDKFSESLILFLEKLCENIAIAISQRRSQEELIESNFQVQKINDELMRAKEKAEESDRLKSAFLANMSHEIRTPMNAVIGFTEILLKPNLSEEKRNRYAAMIKHRSHDLLRIIEDVLDISKIEVGQMKVVVSEVSLPVLLNELYEYYKLKKETMEGKSPISIKLLLPQELSKARIKADSLRLKQVLNNLLDNALKFTEQGSIEFGCRLELPNQLLFYVRDSGIGIAPEKHKVVFDPFRQAEESTFSRQYGGVGLGLSIVKGMVTLMKGRIWLESELEKGTCFYFTIPYSPSKEVEEATIEPSGLKNNIWASNTLLVVEDDEVNSLCINEMLNDTGVKIFNAFNGEDAIRIFNAEPSINVILMDIRLPDTTGLVLTPVMLNKRPEVAIIAQTAYASPEDAQECINAGCSDYISKPITKQRLLSTLAKYMNKRRVEHKSV